MYPYPYGETITALILNGHEKIENGHTNHWTDTGEFYSLALRIVQSGYGAHPASYNMGTGGYFPGEEEE